MIFGILAQLQDSELVNAKEFLSAALKIPLLLRK